MSAEVEDERDGGRAEEDGVTEPRGRGRGAEAMRGRSRRKGGQC